MLTFQWNIYEWLVGIEPSYYKWKQVTNVPVTVLILVTITRTICLSQMVRRVDIMNLLIKF